MHPVPVRLAKCSSNSSINIVSSVVVQLLYLYFIIHALWNEFAIVYDRYLFC